MRKYSWRWWKLLRARRRRVIETHELRTYLRRHNWILNRRIYVIPDLREEEWFEIQTRPSLGG